MKRAGSVGLGLMGEPMRALGARWASSPREVAASRDVGICMLPDAAAVHDILSGEYSLSLLTVLRKEGSASHG